LRKRTEGKLGKRAEGKLRKRTEGKSLPGDARPSRHLPWRWWTARRGTKKRADRERQRKGGK
jgi:hypothetical protein